MTGQELTESERASCSVCAAYLASGRLWSALALALAVISMIAMVFSPVWSGIVRPVGIGASLCVILLERILSSRVAIDTLLFTHLADGTIPSLVSLDFALKGVLNVPPNKAGRDLSVRIAGARRLFRLQIGFTLVLVVIVIIQMGARGLQLAHY